MDRVNLEGFSKFLTNNQLLVGFKMTPQLTQELFASIDPHKKGFLTYSDWRNTFERYNYHSQ
jgi:hypothetical protein